jgi:acyl carrier protein
MELDNFIEKFSELFDDTDVSELSSDTKFHELDEWSSLNALGLIALIDEEYDVELKGDDIRNAETILDLFNIIKSRI